MTNEDVANCVHVALNNQRGDHWRGRGGDQERVLAAKYSGWATSMTFAHPPVAAVLHGVAASYLRETEREDERDAAMLRRTP